SRRHRTTLWARDAAQADAMAQSRENARYLPDIRLPDALAITDDLATALAPLAADPAHTLIILGVPVVGLAALCRELANRLPGLGLTRTPIVWTCKGFAADTARLPHEIVAEAMNGTGIPGGVLSGPSFAREVAQGLPVALTIASAHETVRHATT